MSFIDRYQSGEREQVWSDLIALGASVREEPVYSDAVAVARETMHRSRHNAELLSARLGEIGYEFESPASIITPPRPDVQARIRRLESLAGTIPLSLRAWYEVVGGVNLNGTHDGWYCDHDQSLHGYFDPLWIYPIDGAIEECVELDRHSAPYRILIAPDAIHKYGDSGGEP